MKNWLVSLLCFMILAIGCGTTSNYLAQIEKEPENKDDSLVISIKDGENLVSDLKVVGIFEMARMDHGTIELPFLEQQNGFYEAKLQLPMPGEWVSTITITTVENVIEQTLTFDVPVTDNHTSHGAHNSLAEAVATINGDPVLEEDLEFYQFINQLQISMYREAEIKSSDGEENTDFWEAEIKQANNLNTLLTQIIRLRAMSLLALEKGHEATEKEINEEIAKVRNELSKSAIAKEMITEFGEERFWDKQQSQYEMIVLVNKVQQDMIEKMKEQNPNANMSEVNFYAQKEYEELLVSHIGTLEVKVLTK